VDGVADTQTENIQHMGLGALKLRARINAFRRYRLALLTLAGLLVTGFLVILLRGFIEVWILGATTFLMLAIGGIKDGALNTAAHPPPAPWFPDYSGYQRAGLMLGALTVLAASLYPLFAELGMPQNVIRVSITLLTQISGGVTNWIVLRRLIWGLSMLAGSLPYFGKRVGRFTQQHHIYLFIMLASVAFLIFLAVSTVSNVNTGFMIVFGGILTGAVPALYFRTVSDPVTVKYISAYLGVWSRHLIVQYTLWNGRMHYGTSFTRECHDD
jgi:hypothetical protein